MKDPDSNLFLRSIFRSFANSAVCDVIKEITQAWGGSKMLTGNNPLYKSAPSITWEPDTRFVNRI